MAKIDRFYIGQIDGNGVQTNLKPYAIPDNAFQELNNAFVFRGRVIKRFGASLFQGTTPPNPGYEQLQSRLRINIGMLTTATPYNINTLLGIGDNISAIGQMFSMGDEIFTIYQANGDMYTTGTDTGVFDVATGAFTFTGVLASDFYFYPALPVMGLINYQQTDINFEPSFAFDTMFSYAYQTTGWDRLGTAVWSGGNSDYFWGYNWKGVTDDQTYLFVTNAVQADGIKYYDPSNSPDFWTTINPINNNIFRTVTARIVLPFKDRLIFLNTVEQDLSGEANQFSMANTDSSTGNFDQIVASAPYGPGYAIGDQFIVGNAVFTILSDAVGAQAMDVAALPGLTLPPTATFTFASGELIITGNGTNLGLPVYYFSVTIVDGINRTFVNRCRFSLNGDPTRANGWVDQRPGLGGYIDAPTKEAIVTAQFLRDRLIVYFESSTWELAYTGNQVLPFVWQQINTELGAESTFSQVPFDKVVLGVGNVGIHACNGSNVERIDDKIPDEVFDIHTADNDIQRVYGIRDYFFETVYWTFPDASRVESTPYNNKILVYNYKTGSWAINDDSITVFGYYQSAIMSDQNSLTWAQANIKWEDATYPWVSPTPPGQLQAKFKNVIAGNQEGFTFILNSDSTNSPSLQITDLTPGVRSIVAIDHNLNLGDFVRIENVQGVTNLNGTIVEISQVIDPDTFNFTIDYFAAQPTGTYIGGGTLTRVTPPDITTKQYNFYAEQGRNAYISQVNFFVLKTEIGDSGHGGELTVDYSVSSSAESLVDMGTNTGAILGNSILETSPYALVPLEQTQERLWHPVYLQGDGECLQMRLYMTQEQIFNPDISEQGFELHAMIIYTTPTANRLQ